MKCSLLSFACLLFTLLNADAQKLIAVQTANGVFQYESIDSAMFHAADGDQIFVPGGIFTIANLKVNKSVMIFGAGHYSDSSMATGESFLVGDLILSNGASGGLLTGFNINGDVKIDTTGSDSVSNFTVARCSFKNLLLSSNGLSPTHARNFSINENVIHGNIMAANAAGLNFSKNLIEGYAAYVQTGVFLNNDFLGLGDCTSLKNMLLSVQTSNFDNNIFLYTTPVCSGASFFDTSSTNNVFMNNIFTMNINFPVGSNSGFNNILSQQINAIFMSAAGGTFSYTDNYHLKPGSPGIYGGTDSYDVGIYGTSDPFKTSSVPFNPHIQQKSIGQMTNPQGLINVHIQVGAQDH